MQRASPTEWGKLGLIGFSDVESAQERTEIHKHFIVTQHDRKHNQRFNNLLFTLSKQEHFKNEQNNAKKLKVDNTLTHCKKQNVHQQAKQQHVTMAVTGLISHSKETKKRNTDDMRMELRHRQWQLNYQGPLPKEMKERKELLKKLETTRLLGEEGLDVANAKKGANKYLRMQSKVEFKMTDDWSKFVVDCYLNFILILIPC